MTFSWPSSRASPLCLILMTQTVAEGRKSRGMGAKQDRWEQNWTPLPSLLPQRKRSTSGAGSSCFICKQGFLRETALSLCLNYFLFSVLIQHTWSNLTTMYANEYCCHTYKLNRIYHNIWSVRKQNSNITFILIFVKNLQWSCYFVNYVGFVNNKTNSIFLTK